MPPIKLSPESENLYTAIVADAQASDSDGKMRKLFYQQDCAALCPPETANDTNALLLLINELCGVGLLRSQRSASGFCWSARPRQAAEQIKALGQDERMLYEYVENSFQTGIWLRELRKRSQLETTRVDKAMSSLEKKKLVKVVRNVRAPAQKTYMLYHLIPTDDVTGGSFFDAGDLDESLIEEVGNLIIFHVKMVSWNEHRSSKRVKREHTPISLSDGEDATAGAPAVQSPQQTKKRKRNATGDIEDSAPPSRSKHRHSPHHTQSVITQLAHPAGSGLYPTAESVHTFITTTDAIRQNKAQQLTVAEIQNVIDVLVWDDKLEKVDGGVNGATVGYRTIRGVSFRPPGMEPDEEDDSDDEVGNGLTQAPCGRCPVFDLCGKGGPINPQS